MKTPWIAAALGALALLAGVGAWQRSRPVPSVPVPAGLPGDPERERLRRQVTDLEAELTRLRSAPPALAGTPEASPSADPPIPVDALQSQAREALRAGDAAAFLDAFEALLASGQAASPETVRLLEALGDGEALFDTPAGRPLLGRWQGLVAVHAPRLGGLLDLLLERTGEPDGASLFAMGLLRSGAPCALPRDRQVGALIRILGHGFPDGQGVYAHAASAEALGRLGAREAVPAIERLCGEAGEGDRRSLFGILAVLGEEGAASLERLLEGSPDPGERRELIEALGKAEDEAGARRLRELAAREDRPQERRQALRLLASRPEELDRTLRDLSSAPADRQAQLSGLMEASRRDPQARERLWEAYARDPAAGEDLLKAFLQHQDPRAPEALAEALRSGSLGDGLCGYLRMLAPAAVEAQAPRLKALAGDPGRGIGTRYGAAEALARTDPRAACDALLGDFEALKEGERLFLVRQFGGEDAPEEARARLRTLAGADPSPKVREAGARLGPP